MALLFLQEIQETSLFLAGGFQFLLEGLDRLNEYGTIWLSGVVWCPGVCGVYGRLDVGGGRVKLARSSSAVLIYPSGPTLIRPFLLM
ncbi:MAG: hypothetical protein D6736_18720 [Nitrospinota bacterium]|nr:MAG: hypothetical protein D6736_18720 [Nitrospinota bacterium]